MSADLDVPSTAPQAAPLIAGELRAITNKGCAISPVRFELDGRTVEYTGWRTNGPARDSEGKPTGIPVIVLELREVPTAGTPR